MSATEKTEEMHIAEARERLVEASLPQIPFDGWSQTALDAAVAGTGVDEGLARLAFPRGGIDMAVAYHRMMDRRMAEALRASDLASMRVRERVTFAVRTRIEAMTPHREAVRRAASMLALPMHAAEGARLIWETADTIWTALGDSSGDYNWYTKRMILSSVYASVVLYWIGDTSAGLERTWAFLDRRIGDVMQFEKTKAELARNPFVKAAMWGPSQLLSLVKAPVRPDPETGSEGW